MGETLERTMGEMFNWATGETAPTAMEESVERESGKIFTGATGMAVDIASVEVSDRKTGETKDGVTDLVSVRLSRISFFDTINGRLDI